MPECCVVPIIQKLCQAVRIWRSRWQCSIAITHIQVSNFGMFSQHADQHGDRGSIPLFHVHRSYYWVRMHCNRNICTIFMYLFAMCVYMKLWNGKRKHISGKNSITPHGGPCQPKRGQEKFLRCKIAKRINEISWEILQFRCGLSSYHPALARLGYQDSSWIV